MFKWFGKKSVAKQPRPEAPQELMLAGVDVPLSQLLRPLQGLVFPDVEAISQRLSSLDEHQRASWLQDCRHGWLLHLRDALGPCCQLLESDSSWVLSSLPQKTAQTAAKLMDAMPAKIVAALEGVAQLPASDSRQLLVVLEDMSQYAQYVRTFDPAVAGLSGVMYLHAGPFSHYLALKQDVYALEGVMVAQMAAASLRHLTLPLWLNRGIVANTERKLVSRRGGCGGCGSANLQQQHLAFWGEQEIQQFWHGSAFQRDDEGRELAYDLARILVELLARPGWPAFAAFVNHARAEDAGLAAAADYLQLDLSALVSAFLQQPESEIWTPCQGNGKTIVAA